MQLLSQGSYIIPYDLLCRGFTLSGLAERVSSPSGVPVPPSAGEYGGGNGGTSASASVTF